jgi:hypothetical protein
MASNAIVMDVVRPIYMCTIDVPHQDGLFREHLRLWCAVVTHATQSGKNLLDS